MAPTKWETTLLAIDLRVFLSLEQTMVHTLLKGWIDSSLPLIRSIDSLVAQGHYDEALECVKGITLHDAVNVAKMEELSVANYLFGAGLVEDSLDAVSTSDIPEIIHNSTFHLWKSFTAEGDALIQANAVQLIAQKRGVSVFKADDPVTDMLAEACACGCAEWANPPTDLLKAADPGYLAAISNAVLGTGKKVIDIGANLNTSKVINYGFLSQANKKKVTVYQVTEVLDDRTCPVCEIMHGRTFHVKPQLDLLGKVLASGDPEVAKELTPWPSQKKSNLAALKQKTDDELQDMGLGAPPYHPGCRGVLQPVGKVKPLQTQVDALANSIISGL